MIKHHSPVDRIKHPHTNIVYKKDIVDTLASMRRKNIAVADATGLAYKALQEREHGEVVCWTSKEVVDAYNLLRMYRD